MFLDAVIAGNGGGSPHIIVRECVAYVRRKQKLRQEYAAGFILLDSDRIGPPYDCLETLEAAAQKAGLIIIAQEWVHEALLLRHFDGCHNLRPSKVDTLSQLTARWPGYSKPANADLIGKKLERANLSKVATVEPKLAMLLAKIGLP